MYGRELIDKEVVGNNGWKIGKSKDIIFDVRNWQVTYLDVELRGNIETELGLESVPLSHNRLPISISYFQGVGDVITLKATKEEIVATLASYRKSQNATTPAARPGVVTT